MYEYDGTANIPVRLFFKCTNLVFASFPNVTSCEGNEGNGYDFSMCSNLETVSFPKLTSITHGYMFDRCPKLSAIFPALKTISQPAVFAYGGGNHTYVFPALTSLTGTDAFRGGGTYVLDFGSGFTEFTAARTLYSAAFPTIILRCATQVVAASSDNSIGGIDANTTVYIPKALYDHLGDGTALDYRAATNWAAKTTTTFACIEGSQYENYYADGTPIPTT